MSTESSELDLTEAVETAARKSAELADVPWELIPAIDQHTIREAVLPYVQAVAPVIEAQVRGQCLLDGLLTEPSETEAELAERITQMQAEIDYLNSALSAAEG